MRADRNLASGTNLQGHATTGRRITGLATAVAPPALVQKAAFNYGASPGHVTYPSPVTASNLLIIGVGHDAFGVVTVTDSLGSSWHQAAVENPGSFFAVDLWYAVAASSGSDTITVSTTNSAQSMGQCYEVSGLSASSPLDVAATAFNLTVSPVVGPNLSGLAGANDFVIYWAFFGTAGTNPVGGIWTSDYSATVGGGNFAGAAYAVTGPTVTGPTINPGHSGQWVVVAGAFHP